MMKVGSIMTSDLLIKLCGHRLYSVSSSLDQLTDESAANQIGRYDSGELCLVTFSTGERHRCLHAGGTCTCRDRGGAVSLGPGPMETLLDGME